MITWVHSRNYSIVIRESFTRKTRNNSFCTPLPAPLQDALHPHAVLLSADEPANPQEILRAFERSLTGDLPISAHDSQDPRGQTESPESIALVVGTSGSTGAPKQTALSMRALRASAQVSTFPGLSR